jgi:CHAT domain-containing protein
LVTHWSIASGAAVPLMVNTFGAAPDTAQALRQAQLQMIDTAASGNNLIELSYPNFWAAFTLIGDASGHEVQRRDDCLFIDVLPDMYDITIG